MTGGLTAGLNNLVHNFIAVISTVSQKRLRAQTVNQCTCFLAIRSGTFCNNNSERYTMRIHGQMYFGVEPPLCATHRLVAANHSRSMGVHVAMARINHQPLIVRLNHEHLKEFFPNAPVTPTAKPAMGIFPISKVRRQIAPWRSRS